MIIITSKDDSVHNFFLMEGFFLQHSGGDTKECAKSIGYSEQELKSIPDEANLTLGYRNPTGGVILDGLDKNESLSLPVRNSNFYSRISNLCSAERNR